MISKKRAKEGALVRIDLKDGYDAFARVLTGAQVAFYAYRCPHDVLVDLPQIYGSDILFITAVMKYAFKTEGWNVVDSRPLETSLSVPRHYFMKDILNGRFSIYQSPEGSIRESSLDECQGLEAAAVWDPHHIEDRLRDHFAGRPNKWLEVFTVQLKPSV